MDEDVRFLLWMIVSEGNERPQFPIPGIVDQPTWPQLIRWRQIVAEAKRLLAEDKEKTGAA